MLPVDEESTLPEKDLKGKVGGAQASCSSNSNCNGKENDALCGGSEIRVKVVAEINSDFNTNYNYTNSNGNGNGRKRESSPTAETTSKRLRSSEIEDPGGKEEECYTSTGHNNTELTAEPELSSEGCSTIAANIKAEPDADPNDDNDAHNSEACDTAAKVNREPHTEANENADDNSDALPSSSNSTNRVDIKPAVEVEKADASSTTIRTSCRFGIRCYRRNPMHRNEEAHPGDNDYRRPSYPTPPLGTPDCPFGDRCYRRNPTHFAQFSHPPETDFEKNYKMRLRQRRQQRQSGDNAANTNGNSSDDEYDLDDPFIDDGFDSDYAPSGNELNDDDDDDDDYDACDRAEE